MLASLPVDFSYVEFSAILFLIGLAMGAFASPNRAGVMNSLPAEHRGAGAGMNQTFQNSAQVLSIGIFFTLMIIGLSATMPHALSAGLEAHGVDPATAARVAHLPPVSVLFASFLGYNPATELLGPHVLAQLSPANAAAVSGQQLLPEPSHRPVPLGAGGGVHVLGHRLPHRRGRLVVARRPAGRGGHRKPEAAPLADAGWSGTRSPPAGSARRAAPTGAPGIVALRVVGAVGSFRRDPNR